ncbi:phage replisome organizer N-terminal domain-containing protein [Thomasclavelia cocleata]|uniref:phage replisome organizer N-terminal domain-containing protein n=1 Tax=Thomasclavelia cocleata TaxID=69824 RepID=UPI00242C40D0|nr:phage replisome organizer N-terminal domain-containing protein [Thomasclavelia cocleata]
MADKRYYWIKLKIDFFSLDEIDFLLSQKNGCEYVVLYQMLCLNTANNQGKLMTRVGEMIVPFDVEKIVRDTKYFDFDTVSVALELFKKLGLVYESENDILEISNYEEIVGSEAANANAQRQKRYRQRQKQKQLAQSVTISNGSNVTQSVTNTSPDITKSQESRVKSLDIRDIDKKDKTDDDFDKRYKIKDKSTDVHFITKLLLDDFLINEDEVKLFDSLITDYAKEFKAVDVKIKAKYILEKMLNRNINNRIAYFTKSMDKNLDEDYSLKTEIINNEDVNEDELNEALKQFE